MKSEAKAGGRCTLHPFNEWVQGDLATNSQIIQ